MNVLSKLNFIWGGSTRPFLIYKGKELTFSDVLNEQGCDLSVINRGDVVAVIGDFDPVSISLILRLIDIGVVIVPLTIETVEEHEYFFKSSCVDFIIKYGEIKRRAHADSSPLLDQLRQKSQAGLVLFSTGTTGRPKAILHDLSLFLERYETPRPSFRTLNFLLFDHIGGINTLLHTLFNRGVVVAPNTRRVKDILDICRINDIEVLPATPTFLRMLLMSGLVQTEFPKCIKVITYGTELMDQPTLNDFCHFLPNVDFRQTYGMSELGILRVKSVARNSLYMKIGGNGVETKVSNGTLHIRSESRMIGYLNAPSPFNEEGWYDTKDIVEVSGETYKVVGRLGDMINVGGLKFMASEVERVALDFPGVALVKVQSQPNPITGQHVELTVQPKEGCSLDKGELLNFLKNKLQPHMTPKRISITDVQIGHRFKKV